MGAFKMKERQDICGCQHELFKRRGGGAKTLGIFLLFLGGKGPKKSQKQLKEGQSPEINVDFPSS
jgi:hypothetical protein